MISQKFYNELGKLLYAIAKLDGVVQPAEEKVIEGLIKKELHHHKSYFKKFPYSNEIILKLSFYNAEKENLSVKEILQSYKTFLEKYGSKLDEHQKKLASDLIARMASVFKGISETERKLMDELAVKN